MVLGENNETINIIACGVGGQGIITLARIIGISAVKKNITSLISEIHGMAQRGGQVVVHIRVGNPHSPLIPRGAAHVIIGLELIETYRNIRYANNKSIVITNTRLIRPSIPNVKMPRSEEIIESIRAVGVKLITINALEKALEAGIPMAENMVLLGTLMATEILKNKIEIQDIEETIRQLFPGEIADKNIKALKLGYESIRKLNLN